MRVTVWIVALCKQRVPQLDLGFETVFPARNVDNDRKPNLLRDHDDVTRATNLAFLFHHGQSPK